MYSSIFELHVISACPHNQSSGIHRRQTALATHSCESQQKTYCSAPIGEDTFGMTMTKSEASTHASQCSDVGPCETIKIPQAADPPSGSTTLMFQRLALSHTEETVAVALNMRGFQGTYDAVHVPRNRRKLQSLGYAFVNFVHPTHAARAMALCSGAPLLPGERLDSAWGSATVGGLQLPRYSGRQWRQEGRRNRSCVTWLFSVGGCSEG